MTLAVGVDHEIVTDNLYTQHISADEDTGKMVYRVDAEPGRTITVTKIVSYHSSRGVPVRELVDRCRRTLDRVARQGVELQYSDQRQWLDEFWARSDVEVAGQPEVQQAVRWNLFQLAQATGRAEQSGVPAKGVSGSGYGGHYFWDTEIYVLPFLIYTSPWMAHSALRFRYNMLHAAHRRAEDLAQQGALFPWRTINGEEASAYYAAGTAQYHIDADISYALMKYVTATGDEDFLRREGVDILVETARLWADLGFWRERSVYDGADRSFHIHGVTGPDEYTTVVNDNLFTNVMARFNLAKAAEVVRRLAERRRPAVRPARRPAGAGAAGARRLGRGGRGDVDPVRRRHRHPPAGLALPGPGGLGPQGHTAGPTAAAAALPPAGDLPLPGDQAGRRRAGAVPAGRPLHAGGEAGRLRLLRPDHHR